MGKKNYNIEDLISKVLTGKACKEEETVLMHEINSNDDVKSSFAEKKKILKAIELEKTRDYFNTDKALAGFLIKINEEKQVKRDSVIHRNIIAILAVAATVLFLLISTWYFFLKPETIEILATNSKYNVLLPDGSIIDLNDNSKISYKSNFKRNRVLNLTGEAFFNVKNKTDHEFIIYTKDYKITVIGTEFNLRSIPDEDDFIVSVYSGKVKVNCDIEDNPEIVLIANEAVIINDFTKSIERIEDDIQNNISWKTRSLVFKDTPLSDVIKVLEKHYGKKIIINSERIEDLKLTGKINDKTLDFVLEMLEITFEIKIRNEGGQIIMEE